VPFFFLVCLFFALSLSHSLAETTGQKQQQRQQKHENEMAISIYEQRAQKVHKKLGWVRAKFAQQSLEACAAALNSDPHPDKILTWELD
jgi:hypothetical protein